MPAILRRSILAAACAAALSGAPLAAEAAMRIALGNTLEVDSILPLAAIERARERGVEVSLDIVDDHDRAVEAVASGEADIGIGAPYALIQDTVVPIRFFLQVSTLRYFPIVATEFYTSWQDLDGEDIVVQAKGSGTEAVMLLMADKHGIAYSTIRTIPGSEARRDALIAGEIKASIVDAASRNLLLAEAPERFMTLPIDGPVATDEALFATAGYLGAHAADVDILVEEFIRTAREIAANPAAAVALRKKYDLLPDLGPEADAAIAAYYKEHAEDGALSLNGGGAKAAADDLAFFSLAGHVEGDPTALKVNDFWVLGPRDRAIAKLGPE